jgi:histone H3/H4
MAEIPLTSMKKVVRKTGAQRVTVGGKTKLRDILESYANDVASRAITYANHAGRTTVRCEDIALALVA